MEVDRELSGVSDEASDAASTVGGDLGGVRGEKAAHE